MRAIAWTLMATLAAVPAAAQTAGYPGQESRDIKSLSLQETADLLAGRGMGLARAGELNHHPGPAHVLEFRDKLALTPEQVAATQASFQRMSAAAKPLGADIVERERALDQAFKNGTVTPEQLDRQTAEIAGIQGRLRAVHLGAHLEMRRILTPRQIAAYDELRGYAGPAVEPATHQGMHHG